MKNLKSVPHILLACLVLTLTLSSLATARDRGDISEAKNAVRAGNAQKAVVITLAAQQAVVNRHWQGLTTNDILQMVKNNPQIQRTTTHRRLAELSWYIALYVDYAKSKDMQPDYFKNTTALMYFEQSVLLDPVNNMWVKSRNNERKKSQYTNIE